MIHKFILTLKKTSVFRVVISGFVTLNTLVLYIFWKIFITIEFLAKKMFSLKINFKLYFGIDIHKISYAVFSILNKTNILFRIMAMKIVQLPIIYKHKMNLKLIKLDLIINSIIINIKHGMSFIAKKWAFKYVNEYDPLDIMASMDNVQVFDLDFNEVP